MVLSHPPVNYSVDAKVDFNRDLRVSFGEYVECYSPSTDNTMAERTQSCLALCPTNNKNGSVLFYSLKSGKIIKSDRWKSLPMTPEVISVLNALSKEAVSQDPVFLFHGNVIDDTPTESSAPVHEEVQNQYQQYRQVMSMPSIAVLEPHLAPAQPESPPSFVSSPMEPNPPHPFESTPESESSPHPFTSNPELFDSSLSEDTPRYPARFRKRPQGLQDYEVI